MEIERFENIFLNYNKDILYYLLALTDNDYSLSEEIMQETFFQAYRTITKFQGKSSLKTWLCAIAKNIFYAHLRKAGRTVPLESIQDSYHEESNDFESSVEELDLLKSAFLLISQMQPKMADILTMRILEGLPYLRIAEKMGIKENSARVLFTRAKAELRKQLKEVYGYEITL